MDQDTFRKTYREINKHFCAYEKGILTKNCDCTLAERFNIAEREGVGCKSETAREQCLELLDLLRRKARFVLKSHEQAATIPHAKAMKVQVGGMRGLKAALAPDRPVPAAIDDIHETIAAAVAEFGSLEALPFQIIIQQVAAFRGRERSRKRR